jgi:hypothetical protein
MEPRSSCEAASCSATQEFSNDSRNPKRNGGTTPNILDLGTRWRWVVSFTFLPHYTQGKSPRHPLVRRLGGPQSQSGRRGERKISFPWLYVPLLAVYMQPRLIFSRLHLFIVYHYMFWSNWPSSGVQIVVMRESVFVFVNAFYSSRLYGLSCCYHARVWLMVLLGFLFSLGSACGCPESCRSGSLPLGGRQSWSSFPCRELNPSGLAHSPSLYRMSYPGSFY